MIWSARSFATAASCCATFLKVSCAEFGAKLREVSPHRELPAVLVDHLEVENQMSGKLLDLEVGRLTGNARFGAHVVGENLKEPARLRRAAARAREKPRRIVRKRHAVAAALQEHLRLFLHHARDEPFRAHGIELIERKERHRHRDAVAGAPGFKLIGKRHVDPSHADRLREPIVRDALGAVAHEFVLREFKRLRVFLPFLCEPLFERFERTHVLRELPVVEAEDELVVDEHVRTPGFVLELLNLANEPLIVLEEGELRIELARNERLADEEFARELRIVGREGNAPLLVNREAVKGSPLHRHHFAAALFPVRFAPGAANEAARGGFNPFGVDVGDAARI